MKNLITISLLSLVLSSCSIYTGTMTGNAAISDANFNNIGIATGTASTTYILGFGGIRSEGLLLDAKKNLYKNYNIQDGQALANITVDSKKVFFIIGSKHKITISADVIDFNPPFNKNSFTHIPIIAPYKNKVYKISDLEGQSTALTNEEFEISDLVFISKKDSTIAKIIDVKGSRIKVEYVNFNNQLKTRVFNKKNLFRTKKIVSDEKFKIGGRINFNDQKEMERGTGKIIGISAKKLKILKSKSNKLILVTKSESQPIP